MGWMSAICDAHKKVNVELLYNWVHRKFNQFGDQTSWRKDAIEKTSTQRGWAPRPSVEQPRRNGGKKTRLWPIELGSICCSSVRFLTSSHTQPFQIKWEVYFSKGLLLLVFIMLSLLCCRLFWSERNTTVVH